MIGKAFTATYLTEDEYYNLQFLKSEVKNEEDQAKKEQKEAELDMLEAKAIKAYVKQYPTPDAVIKELQAVFDQLEKEDFIERCNRAAGIAERLKMYDQSGEDGKPAGTDETGRSLNAFIAYFEDQAKETFDNFFLFMVESFCLYRMAAIAVLNGIEDYNNAHLWELMPEKQGRAMLQMIIARYRSFYPEATDVPEGEDKPIEVKKAPLPIIKPKKVDKVGFPIDKINAISTGIWGAISTEPGGQLAFSFDTSNQKKKGGDDAAVLCAISWNDPELTITRSLTEWDKRVYIAVGSLFTGGNETLTLNQIYTLMGNTGVPNDRQKKDINDSLTKMGTARLYLDNVKERNAGYKYPKAKYDAPLLPFERLEVTNRGQTTTAIHLLREPPLLTFARARKQCTTIDIKVLQSPISKTNNNLRIDDYLLERITHMKKTPTMSRKILLSSIYEVCKVTSKMQKSRTPEKVLRYLNHYQATAFITGFKVDGTKKPYSDYKEGDEDKPKTIKESVTIIL